MPDYEFYSSRRTKLEPSLEREWPVALLPTQRSEGGDGENEVGNAARNAYERETALPLATNLRFAANFVVGRRLQK